MRMHRTVAHVYESNKLRFARLCIQLCAYAHFCVKTDYTQGLRVVHHAFFFLKINCFVTRKVRIYINCHLVSISRPIAFELWNRKMLMWFSTWKDWERLVCNWFIIYLCVVAVLVFMIIRKFNPVYVSSALKGSLVQSTTVRSAVCNDRWILIVKIGMTLITRKHQICLRVIAAIVIAQVAWLLCKFLCLDADGILYRQQRAFGLPRRHYWEVVVCFPI